MTRAERRRLEKQSNKKKKTYIMTDVEIKKIKQQATIDAVDISLNLMLGIPLLAMRDLSIWGNAGDWGKKRLTKLSNKIMEIYNDFEGGLITLDDINQALNEEVGLEVGNRSSRVSKEIYGGNSDGR